MTAFLFCLVISGLPTAVRALTVSPTHTGSRDLIYLPSVGINVGQRVYERDIDFGPGGTNNTNVGTKVLFMIRNDFVYSDRFTIGFNFGVGTLDHGVLEHDTDTFDAQGDAGLGGGLRISGVLVENLYGADWFTDFQFFSLGSDPDQGRITQDDAHLAFGGRHRVGSSILEGGIRYSTSEFRILGNTKNDSTVEGTGEAPTHLGLFFNTRIPLTRYIDGFAEVQFTDQIAFNIGGSYDYKLGSYTPPVVRQPVFGARTEERPEQGESARNYIRRAQREIQRENFKEALNLLSQAIDLDPEEPGVFFELGRSYYLVGEFGKAQQYLEYAVGLKSDNPDYHYYLGRVHEQLDESDDAVDHYRQAVELDPTHQRALYRLNHLED